MSGSIPLSKNKPLLLTFIMAVDRRQWQVDPYARQLSLDETALTRLETEGRTVVKHQPRLAKFAEMLAHPEFAEFFDRNFQTWDDCETSIMLLKMGGNLRELMQQSSGEEVSGHQLAAAMSQVMSQAETRQYMVARLKDFMNARPSQRSVTASSSSPLPEQIPSL